MTLGELEDRFAAEHDRLVLLHIADDVAFIDKLSACKSADVIETLLAERIRRIKVDLHRFALTAEKPRT